MARILDLYCTLLKGIIAACLAVMVVLVFGNVVLRYGFNSGIAISEELSRWLLVWLTFLGAVVAMREHAHLGGSIALCGCCRLTANASASSSATS
ncbi:TRAP-type C4-dicarboxylate transport system permease small subunit [Bradyrhizobium sp. GM6.1]